LTCVIRRATIPHMGRVRLSITVEPETRRRLDRLTKMRGETRSDVAEELMLSAMDQAELAAAATADPVVMGAFARAMSEPGVLRSMLGALREDLSDDQLALFTSRIGELSGPPAVKKRKGKR
jgi:hypothetical protein